MIDGVNFIIKVLAGIGEIGWNGRHKDVKPNPNVYFYKKILGFFRR